MKSIEDSMKARSTIRMRRGQRGIALLISIFILLLISVVAIALIVSSGTETSLAGNYRSSTAVNYAALAGVEEVRARLSPKNPSSFANTDPAFLPAPGTPLAVCSVYYVLNPLGSETVTPWVTGSTYADNEFGPEFLSSGCSMPASPHTANSIWKRNPLNTLPFPGPLYKWVRINAVSEQSINVDVSPYDGTKSPTTPVYYDGTSLNDSNDGNQVIEITALAVLPNGSQKILQYIVAPTIINLPVFPAALTLAGPTGGTAVTFSAPTYPSNNVYYVSGNDIFVPALPSCTPGAPVDAIAVYHTLAKGLVISGGNGGTGIPLQMQGSYTGANAAPDVQVDLLTNYQTPSQLDALAQSIIQNADAVVPPGSAATQTAYLTSLGMSSSKLLTVVANGDLDVSNWNHDGYGLLLVTGTFWYDPDTNWNGIILVIGQGKIMNSQNGQYKQINGAVLVAQTRDSSGNLLPDPNLGTATVSFLPAMQGDGIRYSSCWIKAATPTGSYKILSFHEISQ
jgi:hypothetical protein